MEKAEMTQEREGKILEDALDLFGADRQIDMMVEEMSELTKALLKLRRGEPYKDKTLRGLRIFEVLDEMADVQIMLNQMQLLFGDATEQEITKLERLELRIARAKEAAGT